MFFCAKNNIYHHIHCLLNDGNYYSVHDIKMYLLGSAVTYIILQASIIADFAAVDHLFPVPEQWITNLNKKCGKVGLYSFATASLIQGCSIDLALSSYVGVLLSNKRLRQKGEIYLYSQAWW